MKKKEKTLITYCAAAILVASIAVFLFFNLSNKEIVQSVTSQEGRKYSDWQPNNNNLTNIEIIYEQGNNFHGFNISPKKPFVEIYKRDFLSDGNYTVHYTIEAKDNSIIDLELQFHRELVQIKGIEPTETVKATVGNDIVVSVPADWMGNTEFFITKDQLIDNKKICVNLGVRQTIKICHQYYNGDTK